MENITENLRKQNITVSLHEKNNIYQAVINYKDDNNKRKQKWVSTGIKVARGNKKQAMQKAEEYREQFKKSFNLQERIKKENDEQAKKYMSFREKLHMMDSRKYYDENILYFDYLKLWIEKAKSNLELTTYTSHLQMINSRIKNYFTLNPIKLLELEPIHIQNFYDILLADGLKPTTVIRYHSIIRKSLDYAFKNDLIVNNPADKVRRPKKNIFVGSFYSENELNTLFEKSKNDPLHLVILLTAFYGLRRSEVLGLKWSAIDFKNKTITIKRFYDLRHSCASLLLARNIPMKAIQEWLGHSDFSTTVNVYAHLDINSKILSAEAISSAFSFKN